MSFVGAYGNTPCRYLSNGWAYAIRPYENVMHPCYAQNQHYGFGILISRIKSATLTPYHRLPISNSMLTHITRSMDQLRDLVEIVLWDKRCRHVGLQKYVV